MNFDLAMKFPAYGSIRPPPPRRPPTKNPYRPQPLPSRYNNYPSNPPLRKNPVKSHWASSSRKFHPSYNNPTSPDPNRYSPKNRTDRNHKNKSQKNLPKINPKNASNLPGKFFGEKTRNAGNSGPPSLSSFADVGQKEYRGPIERKTPVDNYYKNIYGRQPGGELRTAKNLYRNRSQKTGKCFFFFKGK